MPGSLVGDLVVDPEELSAVRALHRLASLLHPEGPIVGRVTRPVTRFLALEAASGLMLIGATVVAAGVGQLALESQLHRPLAH